MSTCVQNNYGFEAGVCTVCTYLSGFDEARLNHDRCADATLAATASKTLYAKTVSFVLVSAVGTYIMKWNYILK